MRLIGIDPIEPTSHLIDFRAIERSPDILGLGQRLMDDSTCSEETAGWYYDFGAGWYVQGRFESEVITCEMLGSRVTAPGSIEISSFCTSPGYDAGPETCRSPTSAAAALRSAPPASRK